MKTQISRNSFDAGKRYSGVYQQMGRMLTDADWNEFSDLAKNRLAEAMTDIIGNGTPRHRGIVAITDNPDGTQTVELRWGYCYADGIQAQVRPDPSAELIDPTGVAFEYEHQADFPAAPVTPESDYTLYVDVWERTVLALEDGELLDAGLHGADTCTRTQTMAQIKWCETGIDPEDELQNPAIGSALLQLVLRQGSTEPDPCDPCANEIALQDDVGNYLFRLEVHDVVYDDDDEPQQVTLKWSSENGAEQYGIDETPTGFASANMAYEFFHGADQAYASEKQLGKHLAPGFTPARGELVNGYPDTTPVGYQLVRRWDGFCTLEKSGSDWTLTADSGFDRGVDLSAASAADAHGHVGEGATVTLNLDTVTATLELANWQLLAGDYWQADVRQAIHVAGSEILSASLPMGILHHYLTIGTVSDGELTLYDAPECKRFDFPPLTDIKAKDVCYDNNACSMPNVETVQDALDHLCKERDLRWHNKHLHGWGIVCGLIAECCPGHNSDESDPTVVDPDAPISGEDDNENPNGEAEFDSRRSVCVTPGYALTCNGDDVVLKAKQAVHVLEQIAALEEAGTNILDDGNGSVCLRLDLGENGQPTITVEAYDPERQKNSMFDGTLLMDFFQHCIMDLLDAIKGEFKFLDAEEVNAAEGGTTGLVSQQRRKLTSLYNLIVQIFSPENGSYVFLSYKEHLILKDFYLQLRDLLRSKTFCAMFNGNDFPEYPFRETSMTTFFGKNFHSRVQVHPDGERLYTYSGTDNTINVYDIARQELIQVLEMPSAEGAEVTAITFSPDGSRLYAAASVRQMDTVFGIAHVNDDHQWDEMTILCDITITEMKTLPRDEELIYAVGVGRGLYFLRPEMLFANTDPQPKPVYVFNAAGHLKIDENQMQAYCTDSNADDPSTYYDQIAICDLNTSEVEQEPNRVMPLAANNVPVRGEDGIELRFSDNAEDLRLYVIVEGRSPTGGQVTNKMLLTYNLQSIEQNFPANFASLENTDISLTWHRSEDRLLLGFEDSYRLQPFDVEGRPSNFFRVPVQIQPVDLAVNPKTGDVYALNFISNTVSAIPASELNVTTTFLQELVNYRTAILMAFYSLMGNVLQYLKDCFCHHLLVKCPTCDDDKILYLATVEIRNNEIYKICNFDKRKYVKSFPTVDYWMSLIPVMPLIKTAVSKFCCVVFPNIFDRYTDKVIRTPSLSLAEQQVEANYIPARQTRKAVTTLQRANPKGFIRNQKKSVGLVARMAGDGTINTIRTNQSNEPGLGKQSLMQANTNDAVRELERNRITVSAIEEYNPDKAGSYIAQYAKSPARIPRDSEVTLVQKDGKVMYYAVKEAPKSVAVGEVSEAVKAEITALENRKNALAETTTVKEELASLQTEKSTMEAEIAGLRSEFNSIKTSRAEEEAKLSDIKNQREAMATDIASLNESLKQMDTMRKELTLEVNKNRPVKDLAEVDAETEKALADAGIRTVDELAKADAGGLRVNTNLDERKLNNAIDTAKNRLGLLR